VVGDISHERSIDSSRPRHPPNPETHDQLFSPIINTRTSLGVNVFFANAFYYDNHLPEHKSGGMLNFPCNNMGSRALRHRLHSDLTIKMKAFLLPFFHSEYLCSNLVGVGIIQSRHIADMSRNCPIRLLAFVRDSGFAAG
jgi:hypothetical protein